MADRSTAHQPAAGPRMSSRAVTALVLVAVALTLIVQNRQIIGIRLFIPTVFAPLWVVLAGVFLLGLAAGYLLVRLRR